MSQAPNLYLHGRAVRLTARRPNGLVLVEYVASDGQPLGTWREVGTKWLQRGPSHLEELIAVLPEVAFITDRAPVAAAPASEADRPPARLPYVD